jgi:pimeloyl-ACP methyl ester carboxylesterase
MLQPTASGYAPVNGVELYYAIYGTGDPVVLLHGGFGSIEMFGPVLARLAEGHTVIGIDLQGHGRSPVGDRAMSFEAFADDVAGVLRHLEFDQADFVGYSVGGLTVERLAIQHPGLVRRLVVVSAPFAKAGWHDHNLEGMSQIGAASAEPMKQSPMYEAFAAINPDPETNWPKLHVALGQMINAPFDWSDAVPSIAAPTMIVVGDWDSVRIEHATRFFQLLGGGAQDAMWDGSGMNQNRFAVLPGETHYTTFMSTALAEEVVRFLDSQ